MHISLLTSNMGHDDDNNNNSNNNNENKNNNNNENNTNIDDNKNWRGALSITLLSQRLLVLKDNRMVWLFLGSIHYLPWVWQ